MWHLKFTLSLLSNFILILCNPAPDPLCQVCIKTSIKGEEILDFLRDRYTLKRKTLRKPEFWNNTKRYYDLNSFWRNSFGCKVYKLPIDAGFTCPNRDGSIATGGCIYCDGLRSRLRQA